MMSNVILISIILVLNFFNISRTQISTCLDPNNGNGTCISLKECPRVQEILSKMVIFENDLEFLKKVKCQNGIGRPPFVCCAGVFIPIPITMPALTNGDISKDILPTPPICGRQSSVNKIFGGNETELDEFPWMALLEYESVSGTSLDCSGTLISKRYVLTAAHCVSELTQRRRGKLIGVRLGEYNITSDPDCILDDCADPVRNVPVEEIIVHENFRDTSRDRYDDIALLRLSEDVQFGSFIRPICLPSTLGYQGSNPGMDTFVAGWGQTLSASSSAVKLKLKLNIADSQTCSKVYQTKRVNLSDRQLCAGGIVDEDTCKGDSGGPLMVMLQQTWIVEGVISFGYECGEGGWPGVYTRVSSYDDWIRANIRA